MKPELIRCEGDDFMNDPSGYAEIVGMLMFLSTCTRPDIHLVVGLLARFMAKPGVAHWQCVLEEDTVTGIALEVQMSSNLKATVIQIMLLIRTSGRAQEGLCLNIIMFAGGAVEWSSKLLPTVATSTMLIMIINDADHSSICQPQQL